jgi:aminotransferase
MSDRRTIPPNIDQMARPGSKVLDEQIDRLRREHPPGPLALTGYPMDPLPDHIIEAIARAARENRIAPSAGTPELRNAIGAKLANSNGIHVNPQTQVLVTHGAMHAVHLILQAVLDPGDEVLMFSPTYFFGGLIDLVRGTPVYAPLRAVDGYRFSVDALEEKLSARTRVLLMNCPCNPTGHVADAQELSRIAEFAARNDLLIVSDESYEQFVYDGRRNVSIGSLGAARDRTLTIQSFTKSYGMPGWRIGYVAGPAPYIAAAKKVLEWTGLMCNHPAQAAAVAALEGPQDWFLQIVRRFERNRDLLMAAVERILSLGCVKPASTPFALFDVSGLRDSAVLVARRLLEDHGIPAVAGEPFQAPGHVRIPFGGDTAVVEEACDRLMRAFAGS